MDLEITPMSTPTRYVPDPSEPKTTSDDIERHFPVHDEPLSMGQELDISAPESPPEHLVLSIVMTFVDNRVRLTAADVDISAERKTVWEAFERLVAAARDQIETAGDERTELFDYSPETWFRFVPPEHVVFADKAALTDEFISALNQLYEFKDDSVRSFLAENPSLGGLLFETHKEISDYFGPKVKMALEVVADPEALEDRQLFVLIQTDLPRKEARALLGDFDRQWWLNALPASEGKMEIALE
jgi:hypothetical protein